jgi:pimeloyl-ACP methyl ester carboxylesterase
MGDSRVSSFHEPLLRLRFRVLWMMAALAAVAGCGLGEGRFDRQNARAHIERLAGAIGSRPAGSPANEKARAYLIETLQLYGFDVRVQEADAHWTEAGYTGRVANVIGIRNGQSRDAIALVSHYDSVTAGPGAGDDAFGVAAALEAARVLAARPSPRYSLMVVFTDAEEDGLLGARALVQDAEVKARLKTFINIEAIGVSGPVPLFETGPGTGPALRAWADSPQPRGGSYMLAIYKALPNDSDATVLRELGGFGLNFAAVGNSHAYHTDRERPDRVSPAALGAIGDNLISIVERLDAGPLEGTPDDAIYFSVFDRRAFVLSATAARALAVVAVVLGLVAWVGLMRHGLRTYGVTPVLVTFAWATLATGAVAVTLWGSVWVLRAARAELHPWHASPWRLFLFMTIMVVAMTWVVRRLAAVTPIRLRPLGTPGAVWMAALPVWTAAAVATLVYAVGASYLVSIPLAIIGLLLPLGFARPGIMRAASAVAAVVVWALWALDAWALLYFAVAALARVPLVTPTWLFPVLFMFFGVFLWPPVLAVLVGRPALRVRHGIAGSVLAIIAVVSAALVLLAPAYTAEQPQRRSAIHVDDRVAGRAFWRLGSNEPGVDIVSGPANVTWTPVAAGADDPWRSQEAFVFEGEVAAPTNDPPARLSSRVVRRADGADLEVHVGPHDLSRLSVAFVLPEAVVPTFTSLPGRTREGRWQARHVNVPRAGLTWHATVPASQADALAKVEVRLMRPELPGAEAPAHVPTWLSRERTAWRTVAVTVLGISPDESGVTPDSALGESRFAPTPLGRVHYLDRGTGGTALVFLHGWGGHAEFWRDQLPLAAGHRALFVDLPGHGRSDVGDGPYSIANVAEALHVTLQSAGVSRAVVVGHSLGALVGWHLALRAPDRVEALVSVDGTLLPFMRTPDDVASFAADINPADMRPFIETLAANLFSEASPPALRERVLEQMRRTPPQVLAPLMQEVLVMSGAPFTPGTLERPVLALETTAADTPATYEAQLRAVFPTLDYRAFPNAGHYVMMERPREVNDAIAGFLLGRGLLR